MLPGVAWAGANVFAGAIFNLGGRGGIGGAGGMSGVFGVCWVMPGIIFICDASLFVGAFVCGVAGVVIFACILILRLRGFINRYNTNSVINVAATNEK